MKTLRNISHAPMIWVGLFILLIGLAITLKLTVKAQDISGGIPASGLQDVDIGPAAVAGGTQTDGAGTYTLSSVGADIYGTNDSLHYLYQPLGTNGQLMARVLNIRAMNGYGKAGVMMRESLGGGSREATMLLTMDRGLQFLWREGLGGETERNVANTNYDRSAPYWVKVVRYNDWVGGYASPDGANWTLMGWEKMKGLSAQIYVGLAVAAHNGVGAQNPAQAQFDQVTLGPVDMSEVLNPIVGGANGGWEHRDIDVWDESRGDTSYSNGVFTVTSDGEDIVKKRDSIHYMYQPLGTNGQLVARVLGMTATNGLAKAGVMIRETLQNESREATMALTYWLHQSGDAMMTMTSSNGLQFLWRGDFGERADQTVANPKHRFTPYWIKVMRSDDWLGGYESPDGTNWTMTGWVTMAGLPSQIYVGLEVSAHNGGAGAQGPAQARFDQVTLGPADMSEVVYPLIGSGDGVRGNYRNDSLLYQPGISNRVDGQVDFQWLHGVPMKFLNPNNYGVCWSGEMQAQFTEPYTFSLDTRSEDWVRVWIDEKLVIDDWRMWHPNGELIGPTLNLVAGQRHMIRVEMFNNLGMGQATLNWSSPSTPKQPIPQSQLYSLPVMDPDGSGLPVLWEMIYFRHTGVDASADPDGDGLSNLQEYQYHTNPTKADTDSDGLPDAWEIAHGLDPQFNDATLDYNNSGLNNLQEYQDGLDPFNSDMNGDGLLDSFEKEYLGAGSTLSVTNTVSVATSVNGSQAINLLGGWQVDGNDIYALGRRGGLDFNVSVANADKYVLNLIGTQNQFNPFETKFKLLLGIDGQALGHYTLSGGYGTNGTVELVLPYLKAGTHTVHVFWDGVASYSSLRIKQLKLLAVSGSDANHNGIKDWAEKMISDESGLDNTNTVIGSYTSPVCLEGRDLYPAMTAMTNNQANVLSPVATTDGRWYVDAPLQANAQTVFQASYQNGALSQTCQLQWVPVNLLTTTNSLTIRKGDSLLFTALPTSGVNGNLQITIGTNTYSGKAAKGISNKFATPGIYTVSGTYTPQSGGSKSGSVTVDVVAQQNLPNVEPAAWTGMQRNLNLPNLAPEATLQADSRLTCFISGTNANGAIQLTLGADANEARTILARLGTNGPVLDSTQVQGFDFWSGNQAYTKILQVYPDGSQLVEEMLIASPVQPDVSFVLQPTAAGIIFDDGTTIKTLTATNFDTLGQCPVHFIRPASAVTSVCHLYKAYQGNYQIGYRH